MKRINYLLIVLSLLSVMACLFPFSFMVKLNIGPVREDHVVTANPDQIFLYLDMRYWDVFKMIRYELAAGNRQYVGVTRDLIVAGTSHDR